MIHTAEFYANLGVETIRFLEDKFKMQISEINQNVNLEEFKCIKFYIYKMYGVWKFNLFIDFIKLLNKTEITEIDYQDIEKKLKKIILLIFDKEALNIEFILKRLDYRKDIKVNREEREILLKIYKKAKETSKFKKKNTEYDTTIYYTNKSMTVILYDKEKERIDKKHSIEEYEKNTLRLEVRLFPRHLNSQKRRSKREKSLKAYLNDAIYKEYLEKNAFPIFYKGNHYKIQIIEKILTDNNIKNKDKNYILEFLKYISCYGYESAINKKNEREELKWSTYKVKKYIKLLENLNINPFIIPMRESVEVIENKFLL